jgi:excisionase family DNA binding protein
MSKRVKSAPEPTAPSVLYTLPEAAAILRISLRAAQAMRADGRLRVLAFGRSIRVERAEIERVIRAARS